MPLETTEAMTKVREAIRSAITSGAVDPTDVAEKADASLTDEIRLEAWPFLLRDVAREQMRQHRNAAPPEIPQQRQAEVAPGKTKGKAPEPVVVDGRKVASPRMAARASWWQAKLRETSEKIAGTYVPLADLTVPDLAAAIADRRGRADALVVVADRYERFATEMQRRGWSKLGQMDEATARKLWGDVA